MRKTPHGNLESGQLQQDFLITERDPVSLHQILEMAIVIRVYKMGLSDSRVQQLPSQITQAEPLS